MEATTPACLGITAEMDSGGPERFISHHHAVSGDIHYDAFSPADIHA
jgi:hypothetical protein